jgi:hypothetical protein
VVDGEKGCWRKVGGKEGLGQRFVTRHTLRNDEP